ncbi:MAG: O-antigen ligase domain-containing protein [Gammaproteobacteria bacterium]|nr:O-antigen ligase domain-containing protein [Gammaproteobacteria bacterium]
MENKFDMSELATTNNRWQSLWERVAQYLLVFFAFCLPIALAPENIGFGLAALAAILSGTWWQQRHALLQNKMVWLILLLVILFVIGLFYSASGMVWRFHVFREELALLAILFLLPIAKRNKNYQLLCLLAYLSGSLIVVLIAFLGAWHLLPANSIFQHPEPYYVFFKIYGAMFIAFAAFIALHFIKLYWRQPKVWLFVAIFLLLSFNVLWQSGSRTGYLLYFTLLLVFVFFQPFTWKARCIYLLLIVLASVLIYLYSPNLHQGLDRAFKNVSTANAVLATDIPIQQSTIDGSTSIRLRYLRNTFELWVLNPLFGNGTGGFREADIELGGVTAGGGISTALSAQTSPEQTYARVLVEHGLMGLAVLLALWGIQIYYSFKLSDKMFANLALGFMTMMIFGSFSQDLLRDESPRLFYIFFSALFFAPIIFKTRTES